MYALKDPVGDILPRHRCSKLRRQLESWLQVATYPVLSPPTLSCAPCNAELAGCRVTFARRGRLFRQPRGQLSSCAGRPRATASAIRLRSSRLGLWLCIWLAGWQQ